MITPAWHESTANVATLWDWLSVHDLAPEDVSSLLHNPWKWQPEWERCVAGLGPLKCDVCDDVIATGHRCRLCEYDRSEMAVTS